MLDIVLITREALEAIDAHARAEAPRECCGLLVGRMLPPIEQAAAGGLDADDEDSRQIESALPVDDPHAVDPLAGDVPPPDALLAGGFVIEQAVPTRNLDPEPTRYLIHPEDHFRLVRETRKTDLAILGAFHSHPITRPMPSPTDRAEALPNFLYVIASPYWEATGSEIRAWWLAEGNFQELTLVPVP